MVSTDPHLSADGPRLSFSSNAFFHESFTSPDTKEDGGMTKARRAINPNDEFEFHSGNLIDMITADELFYEGKILPSCQIHLVPKVEEVLTTPERGLPTMQPVQIDNKDDGTIKWLFEDGPSPRPPKCSVLWKELWKLRKHPSSLQKSSSSSLLSSSSSSSSSSRRTSCSSSRRLTTEIPAIDQRRERVRDKEKGAKKKKEEKEKTSFNISLMAVGNVPIRTGQRKKFALPLIYPLGHV